MSLVGLNLYQSNLNGWNKKEYMTYIEGVLTAAQWLSIGENVAVVYTRYVTNALILQSR